MLSMYDHEILSAAVSASRVAVDNLKGGISEAEATRILFALLPVIERGVPPPLRSNDPAIHEARMLFEQLRAKLN